jgi:cytochrome c oxidase subunit 2
MLASLKVVSQEQYDDYLLNRTEGEKEALTPLQLGEKLYTDKGCKQCHSIDGSKLIGPSLKGVFGKEELLADGSKIKVDENYIRESLVNPMAKIVQGYPPVMTSFEGQLTDDEIAGIIAYLKSL